MPELCKSIGLEGVMSEQVMAASDDNGDGLLSFEEFCKLVGVEKKAVKKTTKKAVKMDTKAE